MEVRKSGASMRGLRCTVAWSNSINRLDRLGASSRRTRRASSPPSIECTTTTTSRRRERRPCLNVHQHRRTSVGRRAIFSHSQRRPGTDRTAFSAMSAGPSSTSSAKERHYAHLAAQLQTLSSNVVNAQHHLTAAASQARYIRSLGANQAAL